MDMEASKQAALVAARAADDKKATDIVIQDVSEVLKVTDYFVICTAANNRRVDAVIDEIEEQLRKECNIKPLNREGLEDCTWALLDYGAIVVHVFQPQDREYYRLEQLWESAPVVDIEAAGIEDPVYSARIASLLGRDAQANEVEED